MTFRTGATVRAKHPIKAGSTLIAKGASGRVVEPTDRILQSFPEIRTGAENSAQVLVKFDGVPEIIVHAGQLE